VDGKEPHSAASGIENPVAAACAHRDPRSSRANGTGGGPLIAVHVVIEVAYIANRV